MMADSAIEDPFRSKRLVYRAAENNDKDKIFFHQLKKDPSHTIYANGNLLRPENREASDDAFKGFMKNVLAVFICLPNPPATHSVDESVPKDIGTGEVNPLRPMVSKDEGEEDYLTPIGILGLEGGSAGQFEYDVQHRSVWLTVSIIKEYRDRGFGREAINWSLDWAFQLAGMHSVGLGCYEWNVRGRHLYESLGFTLGGVYRKEYYFNRKWYDCLLYTSPSPRDS